MHTFTDSDKDRETRRHLDKMNSRPWYAIILNIPEKQKRERVYEDLSDLLHGERRHEMGVEQDLLYCKGQYSPTLVQKARDYLTSQEGVVSVRFLRSESYGSFVGNPGNWLPACMKYSRN